jgi:hypothetical protein
MQIREPEELQQRVRLVADRPLLLAHERQAEPLGQHARAHVAVLGHQDVVEDAQARKQLHVLEGARDPQSRDLIGPAVRDVVIEEVDAPAGGPVEAGDAVEDGRLAGAVGADQPVDGLRLDAEAHAVDGAQSSEVDGQIADGQAGAHRGTERAGQQRPGIGPYFSRRGAPSARSGRRAHPPGEATAPPRRPDATTRSARAQNAQRLRRL